jgi:hypothetical protein
MSGFSEAALQVGIRRRETHKIADIIEFVESSWGLGQRLFPVQKIVLKAHYGIPLDPNTKFEIKDWKGKNGKVYSEPEYLEMLYLEGRSNIRTITPGKQLRQLVLVFGRRSGKTEISAFIAAYETYKLLLRVDPQNYYGITPGAIINLTAIATNKEQAFIFYGKASAYFKQCPFFAPYTANNTQTYSRFQTPKDIERYGSYSDNKMANATIRVSAKPSNARGTRGADCILVVLDEFAHVPDSGEGSAREIYKAIKPSLSALAPKDPLDKQKPIGDVEGRMVIISSPLGRSGLFFDLFEAAFKPTAAASNMFAMQAPTWEVNPTIPPSEFEDAYSLDPIAFISEYGAEFSNRTLGWIENPQDLLACVNPKRFKSPMGARRQAHFVGFDFGQKNDASAIAICHLEADRIMVDCVEEIRAGHGKFEKDTRLEFDDIADWVAEYGKRFNFAEGLMDQVVGIPFEQALKKRGLGQFKSELITKPMSSRMFSNFKDMMYSGHLDLYDIDRTKEKAEDNKLAEYLEELLSLQAHITSKYVILVEAPKSAGKTDDRSDALIRAVWLASQRLAAGHRIAQPRGPMPQTKSQAYKARVKLNKLGGSHSDRQIPIIGRKRSWTT